MIPLKMPSYFIFFHLSTQIYYISMSNIICSGGKWHILTLVNKTALFLEKQIVLHSKYFSNDLTLKDKLYQSSVNS